MAAVGKITLLGIVVFLAGLVAIVAENDVGAALLPIGIAIVVISLLGRLVIAAVRGTRKARLLQKEGRAGVATVLKVADTGITINDNPRVELAVSVQPDDGSPVFESSFRVTASRLVIPQPGLQIPVRYHPERRDLVDLDHSNRSSP